MNILLTGRPGVGKSTVIMKVVDSIGSENVGGFWSQEIRIGGRRTGFAIKTFLGENGILAHVDMTNGPRVGRYTVNIDDIESIALPALDRAFDENKIIVIDEIAKMELCSPSFAPTVLRCLDAGKVLGTLQKRGGHFVDEVRGRSDVLLLELTISNRERMPGKIVELLNK